LDGGRTNTHDSKTLILLLSECTPHARRHRGLKTIDEHREHSTIKGTANRRSTIVKSPAHTGPFVFKDLLGVPLVLPLLECIDIFQPGSLREGKRGKGGIRKERKSRRGRTEVERYLRRSHPLGVLSRRRRRRRSVDSLSSCTSHSSTYRRNALASSSGPIDIMTLQLQSKWRRATNGQTYPSHPP